MKRERKSTPHINTYQNVTWKTHKVKVKNKHFIKCDFLCCDFYLRFFTRPKPMYGFLLIHYGNSSTQTVEPPNRTSRNIYVPSSRRVTTLHKLRLKWWGKRQALILFVEKPTKKQKKHTFLHIIHTFSGRFCCCKGSIFGASPSGSPTNRLGKTDPTWRIGKGKNGNFLTNHQWRAGSGELESWRAQKGLRPSPKASLPTWICRDGVTVSHQKKTRM